MASASPLMIPGSAELDSGRGFDFAPSFAAMGEARRIPTSRATNEDTSVEMHFMITPPSVPREPRIDSIGN